MVCRLKKNTDTHAHAQTRSHARICSQACKYTHAQMHARTQTHTRTNTAHHTHKYTHTHIHTQVAEKGHGQPSLSELQALLPRLTLSNDGIKTMAVKVLEAMKVRFLTCVLAHTLSVTRKMVGVVLLWCRDFLWCCDFLWCNDCASLV